MARVIGADVVIKNVELFTRHANTAILSGGRHWSAEVANTMKANAKWRDRTTNARNSLSCEAEIDDKGLRCVASGGMSYSPHLELTNGGKYAIIWPTVVREAPRLPKVVAGYMKALGL